jgi:hypothetical protein
MISIRLLSTGRFAQVEAGRPGTQALWLPYLPLAQKWADNELPNDKFLSGSRNTDQDPAVAGTSCPDLPRLRSVQTNLFTQKTVGMNKKELCLRIPKTSHVPLHASRIRPKVEMRDRAESAPPV